MARGAVIAKLGVVVVAPTPDGAVTQAHARVQVAPGNRRNRFGESNHVARTFCIGCMTVAKLPVLIASPAQQSATGTYCAAVFSTQHDVLNTRWKRHDFVRNGFTQSIAITELKEGVLPPAPDHTILSECAGVILTKTQCDGFHLQSNDRHGGGFVDERAIAQLAGVVVAPAAHFARRGDAAGRRTAAVNDDKTGIGGKHRDGDQAEVTGAIVAKFPLQIAPPAATGAIRMQRARMVVASCDGDRCSLDAADRRRHGSLGFCAVSKPSQNVASPACDVAVFEQCATMLIADTDRDRASQPHGLYTGGSVDGGAVTELPVAVGPPTAHLTAAQQRAAVAAAFIPAPSRTDLNGITKGDLRRERDGHEDQPREIQCAADRYGRWPVDSGCGIRARNH
ncbi:MAG: hypothetical protein BWZ07_02279 [Alphaproteobacteria bacterium ADurb.BinA280]|nr:MAG: hypothetical protein BWZ07_02279 [Alphaproteobacteria bacterium ADurb.BinA280]